MSDSPLKQYALPLLCDMAHASRNSREQLRAHGGLDVYLSLLDDELWSVTALDSIAVCLAHDNDSRKVEQALLKKEAVQKLVKFFQNCPERHFVHILEPFLKIITYVVLSSLSTMFKSAKKGVLLWISQAYKHYVFEFLSHGLFSSLMQEITTDKHNTSRQWFDHIAHCKAISSGCYSST